MILKIREDSQNYACTVVRIKHTSPIVGLDNLVKTTIFGNDVLLRKDTSLEQDFLFFPVESQISQEYLSNNNEFRHSNLNQNPGAKPGFFEDNGRVKAIKFKGVISTGYIAPLDTLLGLVSGDNIDKLKEGDEFTDIDTINICKKYKITHQHATTSGESRYNKKLKRFDKLVPNQFRFHQDTSQLAKNLHLFSPEQIIVITDKWHGTSAVFANVLINKELGLKDRIAKFFKVNVVDKIYDQLYASRSVIKNQYINKEATAGYYNEDIWKVVQNEVKEKIEQGITLYGEIVGYLPSGKMIQKGYDYGCEIKKQINPLDTYFAKDGHKFLVYRVTYTKPDGNVIEFSWQQIKDYCKKYQLETVKEKFHGTIYEWLTEFTTWDTIEDSMPIFFEKLQNIYLEKNCIYCISKVPAEGIVVRIDGKETFSAYKLKSKRFLEKESKQLDEEAKSGEINIEDDAAINNN